MGDCWVTGACGRLVRSGLWYRESEVKADNRLVANVRWAASIIAIAFLTASKS